MIDTQMRILVVDDYNTMRRIVRNLLRQLGFEHTEEAGDGAEALQKLREEHFDLIISDSSMQPMNGMELVRAVRSDPRLTAIPFIMITAESKPDHIRMAKEAGVSTYIVKPFNAEILKSKLFSVFGEQAA